MPSPPGFVLHNVRPEIDEKFAARSQFIRALLKGSEGLATAEDNIEVDFGRNDGFKAKRGRDLEQAKNGKKGSFYGTRPFPQ